MCKSWYSHANMPVIIYIWKTTRFVTKQGHCTLPALLLFKGQSTQHRETRLHLTFSANWNKRATKFEKTRLQVAFSLPTPVVDALKLPVCPSGRSSNSRRLDYNELVSRQRLSHWYSEPRKTDIWQPKGKGDLRQLRPQLIAQWICILLNFTRNYCSMLFFPEVGFLLALYGGPRKTFHTRKSSIASSSRLPTSIKRRIGKVKVVVVYWR